MLIIVEPDKVKARHRKTCVIFSVAQAIDMARHIAYHPITKREGCSRDCGPGALFEALRDLGYTVREEEVPALKEMSLAERLRAAAVAE